MSVCLQRSAWLFEMMMLRMNLVAASLPQHGEAQHGRSTACTCWSPAGTFREQYITIEGVNDESMRLLPSKLSMHVSLISVRVESDTDAARTGM